MITDIKQIKTGDNLLVSSKHGLGLKIQPFQKKRDPIAGRYNHSATFWWINGILCLHEQTQSPDHSVKANNNLTEFRKYLESDSDLLHLGFVPDIVGLGLAEEFEKIMIAENGRPYDFPNLFKYQIFRTLFNWWADIPRNRDKNAVCHEQTMKNARIFGKLIGKDYFPEYYKAKVEDLYWSDLYIHNAIDKSKTLLSI